MALQIQQQIIYTDRFDVWAENTARDGMGEPTGGSYIYQNIPGKHFRTSNFDETTSVAGVLVGKHTALFSDYLDYPLIDDSNTNIKIEGGHFIRFHEPGGGYTWFTVAGFGKEIWRFNTGSVYMLITSPPI